MRKIAISALVATATAATLVAASTPANAYSVYGYPISTAASTCSAPHVIVNWSLSAGKPAKYTVLDITSGVSVSGPVSKESLVTGSLEVDVKGTHVGDAIRVILSNKNGSSSIPYFSTCV